MKEKIIIGSISALAGITLSSIIFTTFTVANNISSCNKTNQIQKFNSQEIREKRNKKQSEETTNEQTEESTTKEKNNKSEKTTQTTE